MLKSLFRAVSKKILKENPDGRNDSRKNQKGFPRRESWGFQASKENFQNFQDFLWLGYSRDSRKFSNLLCLGFSRILRKKLIFYECSIG